MIVLFTDFGARGPYTGQMTAVLHAAAPGTPVVDLMAHAPACDARASAYLLAACSRPFPADTVFLAVVDPGVGSSRLPCVVHADDRWFVGPGNGLFELVMRRASRARCWQIDWRPPQLSATFHGRDLFAPVAARLARGETPPCAFLSELAGDALRRPDWPDDLARILYFDSYGNAISGLRAEKVAASARVRIGTLAIASARTFSDVAVGQPFWYENADGLLEIAVNRGRAAGLPGITLGAELSITE